MSDPDSISPAPGLLSDPPRRRYSEPERTTDELLCEVLLCEVLCEELLCEETIREELWLETTCEVCEDPAREPETVEVESPPPA